MKHKWWPYFLLITLTLIDYITKYNVTYFTKSLKYIGPIHFYFTLNKGIAMSNFSELPPLIRVVGISTLYGLFFLIFVLLIQNLSDKVKLLKTGMTFIFSGMTGNTIDRIIQGSVIDFIYFPIIGPGGPIFNIADIFLSIGLILTLIALFKEQQLIWFENDVRGKYLIDQFFQFQMIKTNVLIIGIVGLILGIFNFTFLNSIFLNFDVENSKKIIILYLSAYISIVLILSTIIAIITLIQSHRMAGPFYAFKNCINDMLEGRPRQLKLRESDHHKELEQITKRIYLLMEEVKKK